MRKRKMRLVALGETTHIRHHRGAVTVHNDDFVLVAFQLVLLGDATHRREHGGAALALTSKWKHGYGTVDHPVDIIVQSCHAMLEVPRLLGVVKSSQDLPRSVLAHDCLLPAAIMAAQVTRPSIYRSFQPRSLRR